MTIFIFRMSIQNYILISSMRHFIGKNRNLDGKNAIFVFLACYRALMYNKHEVDIMSLSPHYFLFSFVSIFNYKLCLIF